MVYFNTKNPNLGTFWRASEWNRLVIFFVHLEYSMAIRYISLPFGNIVAIWYIFPRFGTLCQEKSGIPGLDPFFVRIEFALPSVFVDIH
jgi:hypothetical protein